MKKLLFGLSAGLWVSTVAHAQEAPLLDSKNGATARMKKMKNLESVLRMIQSPPTPLELEPVAGKLDVFTLKPGTYVLRDALEVLTAKTGGKAIFDDDFKASNIYLFGSHQGTVPELIEQLTLINVAVGRIGADWIFVQIKNKKPVAPPVFAPIAPREAEPTEFRFNAFRGAKPVDPKTLPPGTKSWEFNGQRVYHVPLPLS